MAEKQPPDQPVGTLVGALGLLTSVGHDVVLATTRETHRAVAARTHRVLRRGLGPLGRPVEVVQAGVTAGVYGAVGLGLRAAGAGLDRLSKAGVGPALDGPGGRSLVGVVNGVLGDDLARSGSPLAVVGAVRHRSRDAVLTPTGVADAFPEATGRLAVLVPGLCESESHWERPRPDGSTTYADTVRDLGWTPVHVRLNTGLSVRDNGSHLSDLIERLIASWPMPVERIALIGHSQGGLIARAATADTRGCTWPAHVSDVVTLGTPHLGSPLARAARDASRLLRLTPESAAFSTRLLERRSQGMRDLADGLAFEVPPREHVRYRVVAATVTSPTGAYGALVGDLLVGPKSATGRGAGGRELFPGAEQVVLGPAGHQSLLNHATVHDALARWLA